MIEDVRRIYHLKDNIQDGDDNYIKQLYIKSDYVFDPASDEIEEAVSNFTNAIKRNSSAAHTVRSLPAT